MKTLKPSAFGATPPWSLPSSGKREQLAGDRSITNLVQRYLFAHAHGMEICLWPVFAAAGRYRRFAKFFATTAEAGAERDGQHDFDFEIGTWKSHVSRRLHPLTGSNTWVELEARVTITKVCNGRANLMELEADAPTGHLEELNLRLYNPQSHRWSFNFANSSDGTMVAPMIGEFKNGRGEFIDQEQFNGKTILVLHVFSDITSDSHHFEQAFSADGGRKINTTDPGNVWTWTLTNPVNPYPPDFSRIPQWFTLVTAPRAEYRTISNMKQNRECKPQILAWLRTEEILRRYTTQLTLLLRSCLSPPRSLHFLPTTSAGES